MKSNTSLIDLGQALDDAVDSGYVVGASASTTDAIIQSRSRTAYRYLFLLGYLQLLPPVELSADGKAASDWRDNIRAAIRAFQADSGLIVNGELNDHVWQALLQLASFDNPTHVNRWFINNKPLPVLWRAVQVRLYAFGLSKRLPHSSTGINAKDKEQETNFKDGLSNFIRVAELLNLSKQNLQPTLNRTTLKVLFEQNEIIRILSAGGKTIHVYQPDGDSIKRRKKNREFAIEFVRNIARVELWLFGYSVRIGSGRDKDRIQQFSGKQSLLAALGEFMDVHANDPEFEDVEAGTIPGLFFGRLLEFRRQRDDAEEMADADTIINQVLENRSIASQVMSGIKSFGSRLWDGVKRVWRWFKSGIKKLFDSVKRVVKAVVSNITRYIHNSASMVFDRVKAAVRGVKDGFNLLSENVLRGSDPKHLIITHDKDFDFELFINRNADSEFVTNLSDRMVMRSKIFLVASKIIGELLDIFIGVIRRGITTGWFGLMLSLVKLRRVLKSFKRFAKDELMLMDRLDELREQSM